MAKKDKPARTEVKELPCSQTIDGVVWLKGRGQLPADTVIVGDRPSRDDLFGNDVFQGAPYRLLFSTLHRHGFGDLGCYYTNAVKYLTIGGKAINAGDLKACRAVLEHEFSLAQPMLIVCLGAQALAAVMGKGYTLRDYRGMVLQHPTMPGVRVVGTFHPAYILRSPEMTPFFDLDLKNIADIRAGKYVPYGPTDYQVVRTADQLDAAVDMLLKEPVVPLSLDCEWHGKTWMHADRYVRTVQFMTAPDQKFCVVFRGVGGVAGMDDEARAWGALKRLFEDPRTNIFGHNVISDGEWLMSYGIDIRPRVVYDTMLAEHLINETGPFGLEALTLRYTDMGRYDTDVQLWKKQHRDLVDEGYGFIPEELLIPYGICDVEAPWRIIGQQAAALAPFKVPNGPYPSLWDIELQTQTTIYELERNGILIDPERMKMLIDAYVGKLAEQEALLKNMAAQQGMQDFNINSVDQVKELMFERLGLQPVKTTKGKAWSQYLRHQSKEHQAIQNPSTDKNTLELLEEAHPLIKQILRVRRLNTVVKTFLSGDDEEEGEETTDQPKVNDANPMDSGGGIPSKIWPDGRIHTHFSQLSKTGRFKHSKPNSANWSKKAEGYMEAIFGGKDKVPPPLRTIAIPPPGHVIIEGDFKQAELFVLAWLSGDTTMWKALNTPGLDLHDKTAVDAFGLTVAHNGMRVTEEDFIAIAAIDVKSYEALVSQCVYTDQHGKQLSRSLMKETIRISAKNLNFGIPYGRGAEAIARQVKGETGSSVPLSELEIEIQAMMDAWKTSTYPRAWDYMMQCAAAVLNPGYLVTPWGRVRHFPKTKDEYLISSLQREAQNFTIQGTVSDTCSIAMLRMREYRARHGLNFRLINQVHDAIMVEVPEAEIDKTVEMFHATMGTIDIESPGKQPLRLGVDVDVLNRWGEKRKKVA